MTNWSLEVLPRRGMGGLHIRFQKWRTRLNMYTELKNFQAVRKQGDSIVIRLALK